MTALTKPQPPPAPSSGTEAWPVVIADLEALLAKYEVPPGGVFAALIADMKARDEFGRAKYGTALKIGNGRDALVDAYQEFLDGVVYVRLELLQLPADANATLRSTLERAFREALWLAIDIRGLILTRDGR